MFQPATKELHTKALINTIESGNVDALGHLGNPTLILIFMTVAECAAEHNVAIEINNSTLRGHSRVGSIERCYEIARVVKKPAGILLRAVTPTSVTRLVCLN